MSAPHLDDRDWVALTLGERLRQLEVEGYLVLPGLLAAGHLARLKAQTAGLETIPVDYSIHYRPAWAGPIQEVQPWDPDELARLPGEVRALYADRNTRHWNFGGGNKPPGMASQAPGLNPSRWERS